MNLYRSVLFAALLSGAVAGPSLASGSYNSRPPRVRPGAQKGANVDAAKFSLGQHVFNGKTRAAQPEAMDAQKPRLNALQSMLPASVAKKKDLAALAGKVTEEQLTALEYFVSERYGGKR